MAAEPKSLTKSYLCVTILTDAEQQVCPVQSPLERNTSCPSVISMSNRQNGKKVWGSCGIQTRQDMKQKTRLVGKLFIKRNVGISYYWQDMTEPSRWVTELKISVTADVELGELAPKKTSFLSQNDSHGFLVAHSL